jgi:hypothetical protein
LENSGSVAFSTGGYTRLATQADSFLAKSMAHQSLCSLSATMIKMTRMTMTEAPTPFAFLKDVSLFMLGALEITLSMKFRLTTWMRNLTKTKTFSSREEPSKMLKTISILTPSKEYPPCMLWELYRGTTFHSRTTTQARPSIGKTIPLH